MSADIPSDIVLAGLAQVSFYFGRHAQYEVQGLVVNSLFNAMQGRGDWDEFEDWMGTKCMALGGRPPAACVARGFASAGRIRLHVEASFAMGTSRRRPHG